MMKTSSGDTINLDFSNEQSLEMKNNNNGNSSASHMKFSSMQSFQFNIESNGLDEQDKKEIAAFMELAQPKIDSFLEELSEDKQTSPVNKVATDIVNLLNNLDEKNADFKNYAKSSVVDMFDNSMEKQIDKNSNQGSDIATLKSNSNSDNNSKITNAIDLQKLFENSQKLLEKILQEMEVPSKMIYA